jgi:hypothetical protein
MAATPIWIAGYGIRPPGNTASPVQIVSYGGPGPAALVATETHIMGYGGLLPTGPTVVWVVSYGTTPPTGATAIWVSGEGN